MNEISISAALSASKGGAQINPGSQSKSVTMSGDQMITNVQIIGTAAEALQFGDVSTIGFVMVKNLDATNFVQLGLDASVATEIFAKLKPGEFALFRPVTATLYAKADTADCNLLVAAVED